MQILPVMETASLLGSHLKKKKTRERLKTWAQAGLHILQCDCLGDMRCGMVGTWAMPPPQAGFSCLGFLASCSAFSSSAPPSSRVPFSLSLYTVLADLPVLSASNLAKRSLSACRQRLVLDV